MPVLDVTLDYVDVTTCLDYAQDAMGSNGAGCDDDILFGSKMGNQLDEFELQNKN